MSKQFIIDGETKNKRLDILVTSNFSELSRAYAQKLINEGKVLVNKAIEKPGYRVKPGDKLELNIDLGKLQQIPDITLPIIYEDDNVIVIDKPVGVISHSRGRYWYEPSVASFIRQKAPTKQSPDTVHSGPVNDRAGIVHRLDRATSGVMICAKNQETLSYLQKQFSLRKVRKTYVAVVNGHLNPGEAIIDMPIERNPNQPQMFRVGSNGKNAITTYKVVKSFGNYDLVELTPKTGRTHQLRVHLKYIGHTIIGDQLYDGLEYERLLLHASELEITVPGIGRKVFTAEIPQAFKVFESRNG